MVYNLKSGTAL